MRTARLGIEAANARHCLSPRYWHDVSRRRKRLARNSVSVCIESIGVSRIGAQHRLRLCLAPEVRAVVAVALADVVRWVKPRPEAGARRSRWARRRRV